MSPSESSMFGSGSFISVFVDSPISFLSGISKLLLHTVVGVRVYNVKGGLKVIPPNLSALGLVITLFALLKVDAYRHVFSVL